MLFALTPLTNLHRTLIYAFAFLVQGLVCVYEFILSFFLMGILYFSQDFLFAPTCSGTQLRHKARP